MFTAFDPLWSSLITKHFFIFLRFPLAISQGSAWARMQPDQSRPLWSPMTAPSWTKSVAMSSMSSNESPDLRASGGRKWVCAGLCQNGGWDGMGLDLHFAGGNCFMSYYTTSCFQYCLTVTCKLKIGNSKWPDLFHQFSGSPGLGATIQVGQRMSEVRIQIIPWSRREHGEAEDLQGKYHGFCAQMSRGEVNSSVVHPGHEQASYSWCNQVQHWLSCSLWTSSEHVNRTWPLQRTYLII